MADFYAIPTDVGEAKLANALALGIPLSLTQLAVGDGEGTGAQGTPLPDPEQTTLLSERRRAAINMLAQDPQNANILVAEQIIPEDVGGWWIREMGLLDADGDLIAVCNTPPTYKPILESGSGRTQVVRMQIIVSDSSAVTLKIDPAVVLATRQYVDSERLEHEASRNHPAATQDFQGMVKLADAMESQGLTNLLKALTPGTLAAAFGGANQGLTSDGYQILPGGLIIQWGKGAAENRESLITFPVAFPNKAFIALGLDLATDPDSGQLISAKDKTLTTTGITLFTDTLAGTPLFWLAIGN